MSSKRSDIFLFSSKVTLRFKECKTCESSEDFRRTLTMFRNEMFLGNFSINIDSIFVPLNGFQRLSILSGINTALIGTMIKATVHKDL